MNSASSNTVPLPSAQLPKTSRAFSPAVPRFQSKLRLFFFVGGTPPHVPSQPAANARAYTRARQQFFVFCLHAFTHRLQLIHYQRIKCEGFCIFFFTAWLGFAPSAVVHRLRKGSLRERGEEKGEDLRPTLLHPQRTEPQEFAKMINSMIQIKSLHT